jgi:hypothetical protein
MDSIINSNDSSTVPKKWKCPICEVIEQSSTSLGLITKRSTHLKKHGVLTVNMPPDKRYNDQHALLIYKAIHKKR